MNKTWIIVAFALLTFMLFSIDIDAQCAMCKLSGESNLKHGGTETQGLNRGILYLFTLPYFLVGGLAFLWWRNRKTDEEIFDHD